MYDLYTLPVGPAFHRYFECGACLTRGEIEIRRIVADGRAHLEAFLHSREGIEPCCVAHALEEDLEEYPGLSYTLTDDPGVVTLFLSSE